jgi:neutral ceramidase
MTVSRRTLIAGAGAFALAATADLSRATQASAAEPMQVSTGSIDITPAVGYPMAGYGTNGPRVSTGVNEPLRARCTILWDNGSPNVILTADVLAFGPTMHQQIRNGVVALGVASADFVLTATHTHSGPVLTQKLDPYIAYEITNLSTVNAFSNALVSKLVGLVQSVLAAPRTTCTLDYHVLDENFSINREPAATGSNTNERDVPVLVARDTAGVPRAVLFSYAAHPVAGGPPSLFDPDYPAQAIKEIESSFTGVFAQFLLGPAGDQNPANKGSFTIADAYGEDLGLTVAAAISSPGRNVTGPIASTYSRVSLPLDITVTAPNLAAVRSAFQARSTAATEGYQRRHAATMVSEIDSGSFVTSVDLPTQVWSIGGAAGVKIVFCGGEVVSGYARYLRAVYGGQKLWFNAYSNEVPAYIPSDELLATPGYAAGIDPDYPGIGGGSMSVYRYLGHFKRKPNASAPNGVEQILLNHLQAML